MIWVRRNSVLFTVVVLIVMFLPLAGVQAFSIPNPFKAVGNALGSVARGVGNIFGQGLAGLAGPTIHTFSEEANKLSAEIIAKVDKMAETRINQLDTVIGNRINQIDAVIAKQIDVVDGLFERRIDQFDKLIDQKIGAVDIVATKAIHNAEDSFIRVIRYAAILLLIAALVGVLAYMIITRSRKLPPQGIQIGAATTAAAALIVIGASFVLTPPAGEKIAALADDFKKATFAAYRNAELNDAVAFAKQLTVIHPTDSTLYLFHKLSEVQRDLLYRPTMIKSVNGTNALLPRVRRLGQLIDEIGLEQKTDALSIFVRQETAATAAVVLWQLASTREQEQLALCAAADALGELAQAGGSSPAEKIANSGSAFTWLAFSYLKWNEAVYLGNSGNFDCTKRVGGADKKTPFSTLKSANAPLLAAFANAEAPESISAIIVFNAEATKYFKEAGRLYTGMIVHDAQWQLPVGQARSELSKQNHKIERDRLADELIAMWANFTSTMALPKNAGTKSSDIIMAATGLPAALAVRAHKIRNAADLNQRTPVTRDACAAIVNMMKDKPADAQTNYGKDPLYALALLYSVPVRNLLCVEQAYFDNVLSGMEKELAAASAKPDKNEELKQQAVIASTRAEVLTSLVTCITDSNEAKLLGHIACTENELKTKKMVPFVEWLMRQDPQKAVIPPSAPRYAMIR